MDLTTIIGLIIGAVLIVFVGIGPSKLGNFWDLPSFAITLGGTIAAVIASYPFSALAQIPKHFGILFQGKRYNTAKLIDDLVDMAQIARKSGLLALETKADEINDMFFKRGIMMIVDGSTAEEVQQSLESELDSMCQRHDAGAGLYEKAAGFAPAFGMIGTLVGLVNMLKSMDMSSGGGSLGQDMSVALITTFYGCVLANLIFTPIAKKLRIRAEEELLYKEIIIEGIIAIQSGDNPKFLRERLLTFLAQKKRAKLMASEDKE